MAASNIDDLLLKLDTIASSIVSTTGVTNVTGKMAQVAKLVPSTVKTEMRHVEEMVQVVNTVMLEKFVAVTRLVNVTVNKTVMSVRNVSKIEEVTETVAQTKYVTKNITSFQNVTTCSATSVVPTKTTAKPTLAPSNGTGVYMFACQAYGCMQ